MLEFLALSKLRGSKILPLGLLKTVEKMLTVLMHLTFETKLIAYELKPRGLTDRDHQDVIS